MINVSLFKKIKLAATYPKVAINTILDPIFYKDKETPFPRLINCFVTEQCNFNCPMCHVVNSRKKHLKALSFNQIKEIANQTYKSGVSFQLSGGEPLMHPEIFKIIKYLHSKRIPTGLVTNGLLLNKYAKDIIDSGLDFLAISLDGPDEETQYKRGYVKGSFKEITKGINTLVNLRGKKKFPNIRVATVISKTNLSNFEKILPLVKKLKADQWSLSHFFYYHRGIKKSQQRFFDKYHTGNDIWGQDLGIKKEYLSKNEIKTLKNKLNKISKIKNNNLLITVNNSFDLEKYYNGTLPSKKSKCSSPFRQVFLRGNGDVEICHGFIAGNINSKTIKQIWNSLKVNKFRKLFKKIKTIPACFRCCALDIKFD